MRVSRRVLGFTLIELMMVVAIISLLAAAAVPTFGRFVRRSKMSESVISLRRMYNGASAYFSFEYSNRDGDLVETRFPASAPPMPALSALGATRIETRTWEGHPTWDALCFAIADPHFYAYQFDSSGVNNEASFTASAFGDLDGDGTYSTFVRFATVDSMMVRGTQGVYMNQPSE